MSADDKDFISKSPALQRVIDKDEEVWCCMCCKSEGRPLGNCLQKMSNGLTTNARVDMKSKHRKEWDAIEGKSTPTNKPGRVKKRNVDAATILSPNTGFWAKKQKPASTTPSKSKQAQQTVQTLQNLQFKFINNAGLPDRTVENQNLRNIIDYCIDNAKYLKGQSIHMSRRKHVTIQFSCFQDLIDTISSKVKHVREWYIKHTGSRQPFLVVGYDDVWDGKRKKINGLTIFFIDPETLDMHRIPVALTKVDSETALALSKTCLHGLDRVGIEFEDLFRSVNDNCTTAIKTGRLIVGGAMGETERNRVPGLKNGTCDMHTANLTSGLALSFVERRVAGKVVNYWSPFRDLYAQLKSRVKYLFDRKNKLRLQDY